MNVNRDRLWFTFEGVNGSGKTSIIDALIKDYNPRSKYVVTRLKECDFGAIGDYRNNREACLEHMDAICRKSIDHGITTIILLDRCEMSHFIYQSEAMTHNMFIDNDSAMKGNVPDVTFILDAPPIETYTRLINSDRKSHPSLEEITKLTRMYRAWGRVYRNAVMVDTTMGVKESVKAIKVHMKRVMRRSRVDDKYQLGVIGGVRV